MTIKYYMKNMIFGVVAFIITFNSYVKDPHNERMIFLLVSAVINGILFPYARMTVETIALKYTSKEFWHKGFFSDDIGKNGLVAMFCFFVTFFPCLCLFYGFLLRKKNKYTYNTKKDGLWLIHSGYEQIKPSVNLWSYTKG